MASLHPPKSLYCRNRLNIFFARTATRAFTTSAPRRKHGAVPTFTPTSSPELDSLLSTVRTNIFLPSHLLKPQKSLLYRQKNHSLLTNPEEPATVKLGNEVHQLHPLDRVKDEPSTRKSLRKMMELCEGGDWVNVIPFLQGMRDAGRVIRGDQTSMMIRRMSKKGGEGVVLEVLRRTGATGVRLGDIRVARQVMWCAVRKCINSGFEQESVKEAERFVENAWAMCSEERHVDKETKAEFGDPKTRPEIVGVVLWARALRSVLFEEARDEDGKVRRAAEMLFAVWQNPSKAAAGHWRDANMELDMWAPVWHGMNMARKVIGETTPLGRDLGNIITLDLEPLLGRSREVVSTYATDPDKRRGMITYEQLSKVAPLNRS
ncbi:MAG: hypothetical protein Q9174_005451 [Haloplaca sp. 1 TL-2023]